MNIKKLIELLKLHVNENKANVCLKNSNSTELSPLMENIPINFKKEHDFAETVKIVEESQYVINLLEENK